MLDAYDAVNTVRHEDDDIRFDDTTPDIDLINALARDKPRPVFVTADQNIRKRYPDERRALVRSGLTVIFLRRGFHQQPFHVQAVKLLTVWPTVVADTSRCKIPTAFELRPSARKLDRISATKDLP